MTTPQAGILLNAPQAPHIQNPVAPPQAGMIIQPVGPPQAAYPPVAQYCLNEAGAKSYLAESGYSAALQDLFLREAAKIPMRYFICDDSGSMDTPDGSKLTSMTGPIKKLNGISRWNEMTDTMKFHLGLAHASNAMSEFRFLNTGVPVLVGGGPQSNQARVQFQNYLDGSTNGATPLCRHIGEIIASVRTIEPHLRQTGQKACIIIVTDGEASDGNLAQALQPLKGLPVWVIIRLCTSQESISAYYEDMDKLVEGVQMDVLDDLFEEGVAINSLNPWLTYNVQMHRLREFGCGSKELDALDERALSLDQIHGVVPLLLGGGKSIYPHPDVDWKGFKGAVDAKLRSDPLNKMFHIPTSSKRDIIDLKSMGTKYGKEGGCCTIS